ncbi:MAG: hypothetical protein ACYCOU_19390 [Sulfobacillus sp.]
MISRKDLLEEAVMWIARQATMVPVHPGRDINGADHSGHYPIVTRAALAEAHKWLEKPIGTVISGGGDLLVLVEAVCREWRQRAAAPLAYAWLRGDDKELSVTPDDLTTTLVGIAAAAAVVAAVTLVRCNRSVQIQQHILRPSLDFQALASIGSGRGEAASLATRIQASISEPRSWTLRTGLTSLSIQEKRLLLAALADGAVFGVTRIMPASGDRFDAKAMVPASAISAEDQWVIADAVPPEQAGFYVHGEIALRAEVNVCTADWWVLTSPDCLMTRHIAERVDELIPGGKSFATLWRAPWGLRHPEDLRESLDEQTLDAWRRRMVDELNAYYEDCPARRLNITGNPGEVFESSTMESDGAGLPGDAQVLEIVQRDGIEQHGLSCLGGSPLLLAVVRTKPLRRNFV